MKSSTFVGPADGIMAADRPGASGQIPWQLCEEVYSNNLCMNSGISDHFAKQQTLIDNVWKGQKATSNVRPSMSALDLITLRTLADVRKLMQHLPKDQRGRSTRQHVAAELDKAAARADMADVSIALRISAHVFILLPLRRARNKRALTPRRWELQGATN